MCATLPKQGVADNDNSNCGESMNKNLYCAECDMEYRVKHDSSDEIFVPRFCPFCGKPTDEDDEYDVEEEEDE
jgi:hypothetical protein